MQFPIQFICATHDYADYGHIVPAPYLRRSFTLDPAPEQAEVLVSGLGFYRIFVNGKEITKGILAPYISSPDHMVYYDRYDLSGLLTQGPLAGRSHGGPSADGKAPGRHGILPGHRQRL